jgi:hypothetical protein
MNKHELGYYLRKMIKLERQIDNKEDLLWNIEWTTYQRKAAKLCSMLDVTAKQKELVFKHI